MRNEEHYININDCTQYILVRGIDENKPLVLFLHGGPGAPLSTVASNFHPKYEENFIVAHWDQRGTGKSYSPTIPSDTMTIEQLVADTLEVTDFLRNKYNKEKIYIIGLSFGSVLGLISTYQHPEKYHAYIGSGQVIGFEKGEKTSYDFIFNFVNEFENEEAIEELKNNEYPYENIQKGMATRNKWIREYGFGERVSSKLYMEYGEEIVQELIQGILFSESTIIPNAYNLNLEYIRELKIPVYFLQGREDYQVPSIIVKDYYDQLVAPIKQFIWFEDSAHDAIFSESEKFVNHLIEIIK